MDAVLRLPGRCDLLCGRHLKSIASGNLPSVSKRRHACRIAPKSDVSRSCRTQLPKRRRTENIENDPRESRLTAQQRDYVPRRIKRGRKIHLGNRQGSTSTQVPIDEPGSCRTLSIVASNVKMALPTRNGYPKYPFLSDLIAIIAKNSSKYAPARDTYPLPLLTTLCCVCCRKFLIFSQNSIPLHG